jgi:transposase
MGLEPEPSKEGSWMMAQNGLVVAGIDIAKDKVDVCIRAVSQLQTFPSTAEGRRQLISWLRKHKVTKAVMEASGGYERDWAKALRVKDIEVRIVDPKRVRHFAKSAGRLAKNDVIDADTIAWFAEIFGEAPGQAHDAARETLRQMVNARLGLMDMRTMVSNKDEHDVPEPVRKSHAQLLKSIAVEIANLEAAIAAMVKATPHFAARAEAVSALLGVAPYDDDSGKRQGGRQINGGRRKARNLFYMACMGAATRHNPALKAFYQRLIAKGKLAKVALVACMRKLIVILNIMLARGEKWDASRYAVS